MSILVARGVTMRFGGLTAVGNLDLDIKEQSISAVIGPNGAGKTTFFNCVTGFYRATSGDIQLDGRSIVGLRPDQIVQRGIARTYQNIRLFPNLTAIENVQVGEHIHLTSGVLGTLFRTPATVREEEGSLEEARRLIKFVGLGGRGDYMAKNLAYGDQRRLEIARALATRPRLLLLDEPAAGMNPKEAAELMTFIRHLRDELGITLLMIEHQMRVVMGVSEQVTVLDYGEKIAEGTPTEIQNNARVIEAYLGRGSAVEALKKS